MAETCYETTFQSTAVFSKAVQWSSQDVAKVTLPLRSREAVQRNERGTCPLCERNMLKRVLNRHLRTMHYRIQNFQCLKCPETFIRQDSLTRHGREQHGDMTRLVRCSVCGAHLRRRALVDHNKSRKCRDAIMKQDKSYSIATAIQRDNNFPSIRSPTKNSIANPVIICAYLYAKSTLYASANWTMRASSSIKTAVARYSPRLGVTTEVLELQSLAMQSIIRKLRFSRLDQDPDLVTALYIFSYAYLLINGPESTKTYQRAFKTLLGQCCVRPSSTMSAIAKACYEISVSHVPIPQGSLDLGMMKIWSRAELLWEGESDSSELHGILRLRPGWIYILVLNQ